MRKTIFTLLTVILCSASVNAQRWVDVGLKGGWGASLLINQNIFDDNTFSHRISSSYSFGGKFGYNLNANHEITFDFMLGHFDQKFNFNEPDLINPAFQPEYSKNMIYKSMDMLFMYRFNKDGRYLEVGPQYSLIQKAYETNTFTNEINADKTDYLNPNYMAFSLGFGNYFLGTENFGITLGARFSYGLGDIISEAGKNVNYPATTRNYSSYAESMPLTAQIIMEFNFDFAYIAKASCGRTKLMTF